MTVWLLAISHRHGFGFSAHATEEGAYASLEQYVDEWWDEELEGFDTLDMPEDRAEKIAAYFHHVETEGYEITALEVEP